jgi:N-acetylglucosaminyldiphosphoundecaprenol N-acetyl-beta-D-mannosaminyltransferase
MAHLLAAAGEYRLRVYFLGARREVLTALVERSRVQHPGIEIAGFRDGYFGVDDHLGIVDEIRARPADVLFVGMLSLSSRVRLQTLTCALLTSRSLGTWGLRKSRGGLINNLPRGPPLHAASLSPDLTGLLWAIFSGKR